MLSMSYFVYIQLSERRAVTLRLAETELSNACARTPICPSSTASDNAVKRVCNHQEI
jgi:hypothetical protein